MAESLGSAVLELRTDSSRLNSGLRSAESRTSRVTRQFGIARTAATRLGNSFSSLSRSIFSLQGAFAGIGAGLLARSFIGAASETETLRLRLETLTGSANAASKAFETMTQFAASVPFQFQEIQQAGGLLLTVTDDVSELGKMLEITGDIAAASGLSFQETAEQIQRAFSAGINSADLFRERGVRSMLGFEAGAQITAEQTRQHILRMWDADVNNQLRGGAERLAGTWSGIVSMMSDRWFQFRVSVMESGMFDFLKATLQELLSVIDQTFGGIQQAGIDASNSIIEMAKRIAVGTASTIDAMMPVFSFIRQAINNLVGFYNSLPAGIREWGLLGFIIIGSKARLITITIAALYSDTARLINKAMALIDGWIETVKDRLRSLPFGETFIADFTAAPQLPTDLGELTSGIPGLGGTAEDVAGIGPMGDFEASTRDMIARIEQRTEAIRAASMAAVGGLGKTGGAAAGAAGGAAMPPAGGAGGGAPPPGADMFIDDPLDLIMMPPEVLSARLNALSLTAQMGFQQMAEVTQAPMSSLRWQFERVLTDMEAITDQSFSTQADVVSGHMGDMVNTFAGQSRAMFAISKVAGISNALVATWQGVAQALTLPFPANIAAAAKVSALGLAQVAKIRSSTFGSGGASGGGLGGGSASVGEQGLAGNEPQVQRNLTFELRGGENAMFTSQQVRELLEQMGDELADNGGRVGRFQVVTA